MNNPIIILVMGLPGSGKTTYCKNLLLPLLPTTARYLNADEVRSQANDWDFTRDGRLRQARRMKELASEPGPPVVVVDMVAALEEQREILDPDFIIFMDTIKAGRFEDTNQVFERPHLEVSGCKAAFRILEWAGTDREKRSLEYKVMSFVGEALEYANEVNETSPHGLMIGRFQPWHQGHRALFEELLKEYGRVVIGIRSVPLSDNNPYSLFDCEQMINQDLDKDYEGLYSTIILPNIEGVHWGRDVGYKTGRIHLPADIEAISATKIRSKK